MAQSDNYIAKSIFTNKPQVKEIFKSIFGCIIISICAFFCTLIPVINVILYIGCFFSGLSVVLSIVSCIVVPATRKELFLLKDGIRIGKSFNDSIFIPWDDVTSINYPNGARSGRPSYLIVKTSISRNNKSKKTKKFAINSITNYENLEMTARALMKDHALKKQTVAAE